MSKSVDYSVKILEVKNLKEHFKVGVGKNRLKVRAVDNISFDIYKKEVFGLVGESGCGKTTTGRTIMRLYRPTSGTVTLNGQVVGSGCEEVFQEIKKARKEYIMQTLRLNQYRYDVYQVQTKYKKLEKDIKDQISSIEDQFETDKKNIRNAIAEYKNTIFELKNQQKVEIEKITFAYNVDVDDWYKKTKNEFLIEYNQLKKGINLSFKRKLEGIKESAALSDESKKIHTQEIINDHNAKLADLDQEYLPKIDTRKNNLLPKTEYKNQVSKLKAKFLADKEKINSEFAGKIAKLVKPNYEAIKQKVSDIEQTKNDQIGKLKQQIGVLESQKKDEISAIQSSKQVNPEELKQIKETYNKLVVAKRRQIKESKKVHFSHEAEDTIKQMQMIFQDPISSLNPRMTVQEIVSEGLVINGERNSEYIREKVIEALELVGLAPEYISRYPHEFSGGQRQRIGIARALIMNPSVIVADEPISALDVSIKAQVINLLSELREKLDLTILFIAHDLSVVKYFCDRIAVMYFGKIVELTTSEELFTHPLHPYTKSLLSAIPHPDPDSEKVRKRIFYSPSIHNYSEDKPSFVEIKPGHFVMANQKELVEMRKELGIDEN